METAIRAGLKNNTTWELRKFGWTVGGVFVGAFGLVVPWLLSRPHPHWPFWVGLPLLILGTLIPVALKPVYIVWMKIAHVLGWINTRILLSLMFFLVFTPLGLLMRLTKKDPLRLAWGNKSLSYWSESEFDNPMKFDRPF